MIHTKRTVTVGKQESVIDAPIILYRGDREVEVEFTLVGNKYTFSSGGNVIESANATHGQLVLNTPSGENMFSEVTECDNGKVVFVITKEMIDELIEVGFYSFQIRLYDSEELVSRVTIPPVQQGFDIRNPIAAEDETNVVDQALADYSRIYKDQLDEEVPTFDWNGDYNKTEWEHHDLISANKLNKIEDALYTINEGLDEGNNKFLQKVNNMEKEFQNKVDELKADDKQLGDEIDDINRTINNRIDKLEVDVNVGDVAWKNEIEERVIGGFEQLTYLLGDRKIGEVDDTLRFERVLKKIKNTGGEISIPAGEYIISETLSLPAYTSFKSNGDVIIKNKGDFNILVNVGYGCNLSGLTLKVDNQFTGVVCSLNSQYIYSSMVNVHNHTYANARIRLHDLLIVCDNSGPYATGVEINSNGSTSPFVSEGGLYCLSFDDICITGYFKKGINIKCETSVSNSWVHNLFFNNINFKQCQTDISINDGGYCSFFNNIISQPVRNYSKKFIEFKNTSEIIFSNAQYWDTHMVEDTRIIDIINSSNIKFLNCSFTKENINITDVDTEILHSIELKSFYYADLYNHNLNFIRCCKIGRATPYYDKLFFIKIPIGGKAGVNFDITGGVGNGLNEKIYANYSLTFIENKNKIELSNSDINVIDNTAKFDKVFYVYTEKFDEKFVYGYIYSKTNSQACVYNSIFIRNRNHQMVDQSFLISNQYGYIVPLELERVDVLPSGAVEINFPEKNLTNLFIKKESRVVNLNQGQTNLNDFISTTDYDIKMFDVNLKNAVLWNTTDTIINIEKSNQGYRANLKVFSNKAIENVTIEVTALVSKK